MLTTDLLIGFGKHRTRRTT